MRCGNCGNEMGDHGQYYPDENLTGWAPVTKCQRCSFGTDKLCCEHEHYQRRLDRVTAMLVEMVRAGWQKPTANGASYLVSEVDKEVQRTHEWRAV